jgi:hypothetical protein
MQMRRGAVPCRPTTARARREQEATDRAHERRPVMRKINIGPSKWTLLPAAQALAYAAAAIRSDPQITHCGAETCERCNDAVQGGPELVSVR